MPATNGEKLYRVVAIRKPDGMRLVVLNNVTRAEALRFAEAKSHDAWTVIIEPVSDHPPEE